MDCPGSLPITLDILVHQRISEHLECQATCNSWGTYKRLCTCITIHALVHTSVWKPVCAPSVSPMPNPDVAGSRPTSASRLNPASAATPPKPNSPLIRGSSVTQPPDTGEPSAAIAEAVVSTQAPFTKQEAASLQSTLDAVDAVQVRPCLCVCVRACACGDVKGWKRGGVLCRYVQAGGGFMLARASWAPYLVQPR